MAALRNPRHERFCLLVVDGERIQEAYRRAFATKNRTPVAVKRSAERLSSDPRVRARIEELKAERAAIASRGFEEAIKITGLNKAAVMLTLWENAQKAMQKQEVTDRHGNVLYYKYEPNAVNRACELLGKEMGMFIDRPELTVRFEDQLKAMTEEQREEHSRQLYQRARAALIAAGETDIPPPLDVIDVTPKRLPMPAKRGKPST